MKRIFFVLVALLVIIAFSLVLKPSGKTESIVMRLHKKPVIFNIY